MNDTDLIWQYDSLLWCSNCTNDFTNDIKLEYHNHSYVFAVCIRCIDYND